MINNQEIWEEKAEFEGGKPKNGRFHKSTELLQGREEHSKTVYNYKIKWNKSMQYEIQREGWDFLFKKGSNFLTAV